MNKLSELLEGVEVEWKALGDVIYSLKTGLNPRQNFHLNTPEAQGYYVTVREIQNGQIVFLDKTDRVDNRALELINNRSTLDAGDVLFTGTGTVGRTAVIKTKPINWNIKEGVYVIKPKSIDSSYLAYLLNSSEIVKGYSKKIVGPPVISLPMSELKKLLIPIPCLENPKKSLEIQKEIVRLLDTFTERTETLINELTTELEAHKKQYNYYREKLLSFEEGEVEWKTFGDLTSLITKGTTPKSYTDKGIAFVKTEAFDGTNIKPSKLSFIDEETHNKELKRSILNHNDILITIAGATIGKCAIVPKEILPANTNQALAIIRLYADVNLKYVFHLIKSNYLKKYIEQNIKGSAQPNLNLEQLNNFSIPYPSPEEQERIVVILDKLENLTTSISEALPKEIALRKKQYEYYRDSLLTFK